MNCNLPTIKYLLSFKDKKIEEQRVVIDILVKTIQAVQERNSNLAQQLDNLKNRRDREG